MAEICSCDVSFNNTGAPGCIPAFLVWKKLIVVPLTANDGTDNYIDVTTTLNAAYFNALINNADASKRWYPLPAMKNVESTKENNITETFNDQSVIFVAEGVRGMTGILVKQGVVIAQQLKNARCSQFGVYAVDGNGTIYGYTNNETGKLYPIPVDNNTWAPVWTLPSDTTVEKVTLNFQFDSNLQDGYIKQILSSEITGINMLNTQGLYDVYSTNVSCVSAGATTTWIVKLFTKFGSAVSPVVDEGLVAADLAVYNVTDSAAKTITSVTENPNGTYTIVISTAESAADVLRLTPTKAGRDYTSVISNTVVVTV